MLEALIKELAAIEDPRCGWKVEHRLIDVLVIAVCAVLGEAESFEDIALYGRRKRDWLGTFLELPDGIPSHDTFRRVLMLVDPDAFERSFLGWVRAAFRPDADAPRQVAIDGKTVRRSFDRKRDRSPLHLVSAYATEGGLVLAQRVSRLTGRARRARSAPGCLNRKFSLGAPLRPCFDAFDDGHGRSVRRRVFACTDLAPFTTLQGWPGLATVVAVETIRGIPGRGKVKAEIRHYLSSARLPPERLAAAIRSHWRVENGLHRVLDVTFREDASRVRERNAARNLALLRRIALNLARADSTLKASLKGKRKYAGWDDSFMAALMAG